MRIVRNPVLKTNAKPMIIMIIIAVFMLIISIVDFSVITQNDATFLSISFMGNWTSILSIIPLTWGLCTILLLKTKKIIFSKLPGYVLCGIVVLAYIFYYILAGQNNTTTNILMFSVAILLIYPIIIATLTLEGRLYNRVFATIFSVILVVLCLIAAIVVSIVMKWFSMTFLVPAMAYAELVLAVFCYNLEKPLKTENKATAITH